MNLLRPHQVEPVTHLCKLLRAGVNAVDLSDTGTGKTYVAAAVANFLKRPTLAVVPKIAVTQWQRAASHFGDTISVVGYEALRTGRSPFGSWDNTPPAGFRNETYFKCTNCQLTVDLENFNSCYCHPKGIHCVETKKIAWDYGRFNFHQAIGQLIFDEAHRCGARDSLNADMMVGAKRQGIPTLALSATAACGPLEMRALGYLLGLHSLQDFYGWSAGYGCGKIQGLRGWHFKAGKDKQPAIMRRLRDQIIPAHGVRVRAEDIPGFPVRTIIPKLYDVDSAEKIRTIQESMQTALATLNAKKANYVDATLPITEASHYMQEIELLKVPLAVELARDLVANGQSVGIFVNFSATIKELAARLKTKCIIDGSRDGVRNRSKHIDSFQAGDDRVILINSEAGGAAVSLPDETGERPRHGLVMLPRSARTFIQLLGRFHRESSKSPCWYHVLLAARTRDEGIFERLNRKISNIDALNDGDISPCAT